MGSEMCIRDRYAMVCLSSAHVASGKHTFMMSKVQLLGPDELVAAIPLFAKLHLFWRKMDRERGTPGANDSPGDSPTTPFQVRKARRLGWTPTDASMNDLET